MAIEITFADPVSITFFFIQVLVLQLHYSGFQYVGEEQWLLILSPTFVAFLLGIGILATSSFAESRVRKQHEDEGMTPSGLPRSLLMMVTAVIYMLSLIFLVYYLTEDTLLPFYWVTGTFFVGCIIGGITLGSSYWYRPPTMTPSESKGKLVLGILLIIQGFLIWMRNSPWDCIFFCSVKITILPAFIFLGASLYLSLLQTFRRKDNHTIYLWREGSFLLLTIMVVYTLLAWSIYLEGTEIPWVQPDAILVPLLIYLCILVPLTFWISRIEKKKGIRYSQMISPPSPLPIIRAQQYPVSLGDNNPNSDKSQDQMAIIAQRVITNNTASTTGSYGFHYASSHNTFAFPQEDQQF